MKTSRAVSAYRPCKSCTLLLVSMCVRVRLLNSLAERLLFEWYNLGRLSHSPRIRRSSFCRIVGPFSSRSLVTSRLRELSFRLILATCQVGYFYCVRYSETLVQLQQVLFCHQTGQGAVICYQKQTMLFTENISSQKNQKCMYFVPM